jgi:deazaflavin-dependent oxidoreductase (nitroreductase family)
LSGGAIVLVVVEPVSGAFVVVVPSGASVVMGVGSVVDVTITPALLDVHAATANAATTTRTLNLSIAQQDTTTKSLPCVLAALSRARGRSAGELGFIVDRRCTVAGMPPSVTDIEILARTRTVDLTTIGRRSGQPRTIEIWWFHVDGRFIITGTPGRRDWLANVRANPAVTVSAGSRAFAGTAIEIDDSEFKRRVFTDPQIGWYRTQAQLEHLTAVSPMIEIRLH